MSKLVEKSVMHIKEKAIQDNRKGNTYAAAANENKSQTRTKKE